MFLRSLGMAVCALLLCGAAAPPPPPLLEPYIKEGRFEPGDYAWMKGRFEDATPEEKAGFSAIVGWYEQCWEQTRTELKAELAAAGVADVEVERLPIDPRYCPRFRQPNLADVSSFAAFQRELAAARPVADTFLAAVELAEQSSRPSIRSPDLARMLEARVVGEQMLRRAVIWGPDMPAGAPKLSATGRAIVQSLLGVALVERDRANTEWLKGVVAEHGWPTISAVGPEASSNAWLLVQHADYDPVFQLQALRLMEPLAAQGEVSKQNHAYLYDRIMLKLAGKQRYATQVTCRGTVREPQPLEDEANVERLRAEMGLPTIAEYLKVFSTPCEGPPANAG